MHDKLKLLFNSTLHKNELFDIKQMLKHNNMKIKHEIVEMLRTFTCSWTLSSLDVVVPRGLLHNPRTASISDRNARSGSCLSMCV